MICAKRKKKKGLATSYVKIDGKHCSFVIALCVPAWSMSGLMLSLTISRRQLVHCLEILAVYHFARGGGRMSCPLQRTMTVSFFGLTGRPLALTGARVPASSAFLCSRWTLKRLALGGQGRSTSSSSSRRCEAGSGRHKNLQLLGDRHCEIRLPKGLGLSQWPAFRR